jgi:hypothetical protein
VNRDKHPKAILVIAVLLLGGVLSGCGSADAAPLAGSAAVMGTERISLSDLDVQVQKVQTELSQPKNTPPPRLATANLQRMIQEKLIDQAAAKLPVTVTKTEVVAGLDALAAQNGGAASLRKIAAQAGIPGDSLENVVRSNLLVAKIGKKLAPAGSLPQQGQAAMKQVSELAADLNVRVAPRYGVWSSETLVITDQSAVTSPPPMTTPKQP